MIRKYINCKCGSKDFFVNVLENEINISCNDCKRVTQIAKKSGGEWAAVNDRTDTEKLKKMAVIASAYTLNDLETILNVSRRTLMRWIESGKIRAVKIGGKWRIKEDDLQEFISGKAAKDERG